MPVTTSQTLTTPSESPEIAIPSFACRVIDLTGAEIGGKGFRLSTTEAVDKTLICQNFMDPGDNEMRKVEEENTRETMGSE